MIQTFFLSGSGMKVIAHDVPQHDPVYFLQVFHLPGGDHTISRSEKPGGNEQSCQFDIGIVFPVGGIPAFQMAVCMVTRAVTGIHDPGQQSGILFCISPYAEKGCPGMVFRKNRKDLLRYSGCGPVVKSEVNFIPASG